MRPNSQSSKPIEHEVPDEVQEIFKYFSHIVTKLQGCARLGRWGEYVNPQNFSLEYDASERRVTVLLSFRGKKDHLHELRMELVVPELEQSSQDLECEWSYLFDNVDPADGQEPTAQPFAEYYMFGLWDMDYYEAELCHCDRGVRFCSGVSSVMDVMDDCARALVNSIEEFFGDEPAYNLQEAYACLSQVLRKVKSEAGTGRWAGVEPQHFRIIRNEREVYLVLCYAEPGVYSMTFKVGAQIGGFDPVVSGEWFECIYEYACQTDDADIRDYYDEEQQRYLRYIKTILDSINCHVLFFYGDEDRTFSMAVERGLVFQKYGLMLDVAIPFKDKYEASRPLITRAMLDTKKKVETLLKIETDVVKEDISVRIFTRGSYTEEPGVEDPDRDGGVPS